MHSMHRMWLFGLMVLPWLGWLTGCDDEPRRASWGDGGITDSGIGDSDIDPFVPNPGTALSHCEVLDPNQGPEIVTTYSSNNLADIGVAATGSAGFIDTVFTNTTNGASLDVQRYDEDAEPVGEVFNTGNVFQVQSPAIAAGPNGRMLAFVAPQNEEGRRAYRRGFFNDAWAAINMPFSAQHYAENVDVARLSDQSYAIAWTTKRWSPSTPRELHFAVVERYGTTQIAAQSIEVQEPAIIQSFGLARGTTDSALLYITFEETTDEQNDPVHEQTLWIRLIGSDGELGPARKIRTVSGSGNNPHTLNSPPVGARLINGSTLVAWTEFTLTSKVYVQSIADDDEEVDQTVARPIPLGGTASESPSLATLGSATILAYRTSVSPTTVRLEPLLPGGEPVAGTSSQGHIVHDSALDGQGDVIGAGFLKLAATFNGRLAAVLWTENMLSSGTRARIAWARCAR